MTHNNEHAQGIGVEECAGPILQQVVNGDGFEEAIAQPKTKQEMIDCQISEVLSAIEQLVVATIEENISSLTVGDEVDKKVAEIVGLRLKELEERLSAIEQAIDSLVAQQQEMNMDKGGPGEEVVGEETQPNQQKMDTQEKQEKIDSKTDGGEEKKMEEGADDKNEDGELGVGQKDAAQDDVDDEDITSETSKLVRVCMCMCMHMCMCMCMHMCMCICMCMHICMHMCMCMRMCMCVRMCMCGESLLMHACMCACVSWLGNHQNYELFFFPTENHKSDIQSQDW